MENHKQAQPYELLVDLFLSEESLDVRTTRDSSIINIKEVVRRSPRLKRFVGHADEFVKPVFIDKSQRGFVFRFEHNKRDLCLKLFYDYQAPYTVQERTLAFICPFACEARAFARLCDLHENGHWAVQCHGWMYLTDSQLQQLQRVSGRERHDPSWNNARWAIVKDFIAEEPPSRQDEEFQQIISNFVIPRRGYIMPQDVKKDNYRGTLIVDLGSTFTFPIYRSYASLYEFNAIYKSLDECGLPYWD